MKFLSKSQTLKNLRLKRSTIPQLIIFNCNKYKKNKKKILLNIQKKFPNSKIAVRSSFNNEDTAKSSNAGKYKSFLNIETKNLESIEKSIDDVINSKKKIFKGESFFVQKMVDNVSFSGVVLTKNLEDYSQCININYFNGKNTEAVTSGKFNTKNIIY